jgi:hypothetical protein
MCATLTRFEIMRVRDCCDSNSLGSCQPGDRSSPLTGRRGPSAVDSALGQVRTSRTMLPTTRFAAARFYTYKVGSRYER